MNDAFVVAPRKRFRAPVVPAVVEATKPGICQHSYALRPSCAVIVVRLSDGVVTLVEI